MCRYYLFSCRHFRSAAYDEQALERYQRSTLAVSRVPLTRCASSGMVVSLWATTVATSGVPVKLYPEGTLLVVKLLPLTTACRGLLAPHVSSCRSSAGAWPRAEPVAQAPQMSSSPMSPADGAAASFAAPDVNGDAQIEPRPPGVAAHPLEQAIVPAADHQKRGANETPVPRGTAPA